MSATVIVWKRADGGITFSWPALENRRRDEETGAFTESEAEWLERTAARARQVNPRLAGATRLPNRLETEVPATRRFRDCWREDGTGRIAVDMPLARGQRMAEIRAERDKRLAASDGPMLRATEQANAAEIARLKTARQALRDVPAGCDLEACATPEKLEAFEPAWPEI